MLQIDVLGIPAPQGSKNSAVKNGRVVMWEASKKVKTWRHAVEAEARNEIYIRSWETTDEPCEVTVVFRLPKPVSARRRWPSVKPDLDKLLRSTLDGLTDAGVWSDDSRVVAIAASKDYATDTTPPGAYITINVCDMS